MLPPPAKANTNAKTNRVGRIVLILSVTRTTMPIYGYDCNVCGPLHGDVRRAD
jgi:hypothetical protein